MTIALERVRERERERERVDVAPIVEKMVESRRRACVEETYRFRTKESRSNGGQPDMYMKARKTIEETVEKDLEVNGLDIDMAYDKTLQHRLIYVADPA